jgi:hypothetical protein
VGAGKPRPFFFPLVLRRRRLKAKDATSRANEYLPNEDLASPIRRFRTRPTGTFIEEVVAHIKRTGQPETIEALYHGRLPSNAKYRILRKIEIDGKKRPNGDLAPCPMCTPNRFLSGAIVWLYDLQVCAVIGHCCAEHASEAEREFKREEKKRYEEDYLLLALPTLDQKKSVLSALEPDTREALCVYRKFRKGCRLLQTHLRHLNRTGEGRLLITEVLQNSDSEEESDYFGPAGFKGRGAGGTETRDHDFGHLTGATALLSNYNPVDELAHIKRQIDSFEFSGSEENALDFIVSMTPQQRQAAVAIFQEIDASYVKFITRLLDFLSFFDRENVERLHRYGVHQLNNFPFEARYEIWKQYPRIVFRLRSQETSIVIGIFADQLNFRWEAPVVQK